MKRRPYPKASRLAVETEMGFIYVAKFSRRRVIKIGFSLNPENRARYLFTKHQPGRLLAVKAARVQEERDLHRALRQHAVQGQGGHEYYPYSILSHDACREIFGIPHDWQPDASKRARAA